MRRRRKQIYAALAISAALLSAAAAVVLPGYGQKVSVPAAAPGAPAAREQTPSGLASAPAGKSEAAADGAAAAATSAEAPAAMAAPVVTTAAGAAYVAAARQNATLRHQIDWVFGGKRQRGWWLYQSLIAQTVGAEAGAESGDFAAAISRWQQGVGLQPSGVLDRATWMKMVQTWQSRRLGSSAYPQADQLVTVPSAEFYDPARAAELRQVERTTYAAYRRMLAAAAAEPALGLKLKPTGEIDESEKFFKIVSAYRSKEYQDRLRRLDPGAGRAGLARHSPHFTGRALDLYVGGYDPVSTKDDNRALQTQTPAYKWLVKNAERFGFRPYYYEPWHWEYVGR